MSLVGRRLPLRRLQASHVAAACIALLAGIGSLAVAYYWQSDQLELSATKTGELVAAPQDLRVQVLSPKLPVQPTPVAIKLAVVPESQPPAVSPDFPPAEVIPETPAVMAAVAAPRAATEAPETVPEPSELPAPSDVHQVVPESEVKNATIEPPVVAFAETSDDIPAPAATGGPDPGLIAKGDALMSKGEIIGARSYYNRAYDSGDGDAARHIARTYDPVVYAELHVIGLKYDAEKALKWYRKAESAGVASAASDIAALEAFLASLD
jgi:hypothetical protein